VDHARAPKIDRVEGVKLSHIGAHSGWAGASVVTLMTGSGLKYVSTEV
jgi:hypothetical protein